MAEAIIAESLREVVECVIDRNRNTPRITAKSIANEVTEMIDPNHTGPELIYAACYEQLRQIAREVLLAHDAVRLHAQAYGELKQGLCTTKGGRLNCSPQPWTGNMSNDNDHDNERRLPPPIAAKLVPNEWQNGNTRQDKVPRPPVRAIKIKADQLRATIRNGGQLDWSDIHERYVDLWQESRMAIWRAKHSKAGLKQYDPVTGKSVQTFVADDRLVLQAIDTTRGILDSLIKLRRDIGPEAGRIPHWAVERIERALHDYPEAQQALLQELAAEEIE